MKPLKAFILAIIVPAILSCQPAGETAKPPVRLRPEVKLLAQELLSNMKNPVTIRITRGGDGETVGEEAQALVELFAAVSPKVSVEKQYISTRTDTIQMSVSYGPILEIIGQAPGIMRYYGHPDHKETRPFLEGILMASGCPVDLAPDVNSYIAGLEKEVLIRIFTTPD